MVQDFKTAGKKTLQLLKERLGFDLWVITRTENNEWLILSADNNSAEISTNILQNWHETMQSKMMQGLSASEAHEIGLISTATGQEQAEDIAAYITVPLTNLNGNLLGTLCAVHKSTNSEELRREQPLIELMASLLGSILDAEVKTLDAVRRAERAEAEATRDSLTNLYNRLGWTQLIQQEENRCKRYGHPACVINIDVDGLKEINDNNGHAAGDNLLIRCAKALMEATRTSDIVARLGGDEFCVLGVQCDKTSSMIMERRIRECLEKAGVNASVGLAMRNADGLASACAEADEKMYQEKRSKKNTNFRREVGLQVA